MRLIKQTIIAGALALALVPYASAAVLVVNGNGILTGATGVDVGGTLYDVSFGDEILGLDSITAFTDVFNAFKASEALGDQVFINQFDATPSLTLGCPTAYSAEDEQRFWLNVNVFRVHVAGVIFVL